MAKNKIISLDNTKLANIFQIFKDDNGNYVFNLNDSANIDISDTSDNYYTIHVVKHKESYQTIAYMYYGSTRLWWIITKFNKIKNVIDLPIPGTALKILSTEVVNSIIKQLNLIRKS